MSFFLTKFYIGSDSTVWYMASGFVTSLYLTKRSGSVVECLTWDREAAGSSITGVTALCP